MIDWQSVPSFGNPDAAFATVIRPSAYAVVLDGHKGVAVVAAPSGVYLPGGGRVGAESPEEAAIREAREECGLAIQVDEWRRAAIEYVTATAERTHFAKQSVFCGARVFGPSAGEAETDHRFRWISPQQALVQLSPASHRWAMAEWMRDHPNAAPPGSGGRGG